jgi:hypothetical protein
VPDRISQLPTIILKNELAYCGQSLFSLLVGEEDDDSRKERGGRDGVKAHVGVLLQEERAHPAAGREVGPLHVGRRPPEPLS